MGLVCQSCAAGVGADRPSGRPNGPAADVSTHPSLVIADLDLGELTAGDPSGWNLPRDIRHDIYGR